MPLGTLWSYLFWDSPPPPEQTELTYHLKRMLAHFQQDVLVIVFIVLSVWTVLFLVKQLASVAWWVIRMLAVAACLWQVWEFMDETQRQQIIDGVDVLMPGLWTRVQGAWKVSQ